MPSPEEPGIEAREHQAEINPDRVVGQNMRFTISSGNRCVGGMFSDPRQWKSRYACSQYPDSQGDITETTKSLRGVVELTAEGEAFYDANRDELDDQLNVQPFQKGPNHGLSANLYPILGEGQASFVTMARAAQDCRGCETGCTEDPVESPNETFIQYLGNHRLDDSLTAPSQE